MTGEPRDFDAILKARREKLASLLEENKQKLARLEGLKTSDERELRELEILLAAMDGFDRDLATALNWPTDEPVKVVGGKAKYARRPVKWKGRHGYEFVSAVLTIQARENCTVAAAIGELKKTDPKKWTEKQRDLERRFQEIKDYWGPWFIAGAALEERARALL